MNGIGKEILEEFLKTKAIIIATGNSTTKKFLKFIKNIKLIIIKLILIMKNFQKIL